MSIHSEQMKLLTELFNSEESKLRFQKMLLNKFRIEKHQKERINSYLDKKTDDEKGILLEKFLQWELKYDNFRYEFRHEETHSNIFNILFEYFASIGKSIKLHEDFLANAFEWNGYLFKLYIGQGSFIRILKGNEILI